MKSIDLKLWGKAQIELPADRRKFSEAAIFALYFEDFSLDALGCKRIPSAVWRNISSQCQILG